MLRDLWRGAAEEADEVRQDLVWQAGGSVCVWGGQAGSGVADRQQCVCVEGVRGMDEWHGEAQVRCW